MIERINNWVQSIIVAIAITTIIEMLLPDGKNKKYIKVVCSIYILFCVVAPILNLAKYDFTNLNFNIAVGDNNSDIPDMLNIYQEAYEKEIKNKLLEDGYKISAIKINMDKNKIDNIEVYTQGDLEDEKEKLIKSIEDNFKIENIIFK